MVNSRGEGEFGSRVGRVFFNAEAQRRRVRRGDGRVEHVERVDVLDRINRINKI